MFAILTSKNTKVPSQACEKMHELLDMVVSVCKPRDSGG